MCSSHESSIFQIKLKRNTGCFKEDKENERHTNDFRKALSEGQIEAEIEKEDRQSEREWKRKYRGMDMCVLMAKVSSHAVWLNMI